MGAENSILSECEWGESTPLSDSHSDWTLRQAVTQSGLSVTVFQHKRKERKEVDLLKKSAKFLKTLRHPSILRFIASGESSEGSYLVTEEVVPLEGVLGHLTPVEIFTGIWEILDALVFLHDKVGITHNNLCLSSIYALKDGSWKLGGLEHCCKFDEATIQFLERCRAFRNEDSISPEEKAGKSDNTKDYGHVRDVYSFGVLIEQLFEKFDDLGEESSNFERRIHTECLNVEAKKRPKLNSFLSDPVFRNDLIDIIKFLKNITLKTEREKKEFFSSLVSKLLDLPEALVARRLIELLLSRFVLLDDQANKFLVNNLLTPARNNDRPLTVKAGKTTPIFTISVFKQCVIPFITNIFYVREKTIRLVLLRCFSGYVDLFEPEVLHDSIFPHLLLGLRDEDDLIVAASLRALADVVPILGGDVVIGGSRKQFFSQGLPKFNNKIIEEEMKIKTKNVEQVIGKKILLKDLAGMAPHNVDVEKRLADRNKREMARIRREERKRQRADDLKKKEKSMSERDSCEKTGTVETAEISTSHSATQDLANGHVSPIHEIELITEEDRAADWSDWENTDPIEHHVPRRNLEKNSDPTPSYHGDDLEDGNLDDNFDSCNLEDSNLSNNLDRGNLGDDLESSHLGNNLGDLSNVKETVIAYPSLDRHGDSDLSDYDSQVSESAISDEIESQLTAMPSTVAPPRSNSSLSSNNKSSVLPSKSPLQLKIDKRRPKSEEKDSVVRSKSEEKDSVAPSYLDRNWGVDAPQSEDRHSLSSSKTLPSHNSTDSRRSSASNASTSSRTLPKTSFKLGEEFEIKPVKVKPSDSFDFFADMAPEIKLQNKDPFQILQEAKRESQATGLADSSSLSVASQASVSIATGIYNSGSQSVASQESVSIATGISSSGSDKTLVSSPSSSSSSSNLTLKGQDSERISPDAKQGEGTVNSKFTMMVVDEEGGGGEGWNDEDLDWGNEDF